LSDTMKRLNMNMHGDDPAYYVLPDDRRLAAQYLLLYELSLPFGHDLNFELDIGRSTSAFVVRLRDVSADEVRKIGRLGERWLLSNAPDQAAKATGLSMMYARLSASNVRSMLKGTLVALLAISAIMFFVMGSFKYGLISLYPNLTPAVMALGLWGYLVGEVNLAVSAVGAMTMGLVVDDTVHFLSRYLRARRDGATTAESAVRYTLQTTGLVLWVTTAALVLGFCVLATSGFALTSRMGLLSALTITIALIADLVFLPALLIRYANWAR